MTAIYGSDRLPMLPTTLINYNRRSPINRLLSEQWMARCADHTVAALRIRDTRRTLVAILTVGAFLIVSTTADAAVNKVFVFNGGRAAQVASHNCVERNAFHLIFKEMGLLDFDGGPPKIQGEDIKKLNGTVIGKVIRDANGMIIGYRNLNDTMRAYDIGTFGTTEQAWQAVDNNGVLVIICHGGGGETIIDQQGNRVRRLGGTINLDRGRAYSGFKQAGTVGGGTGVATRHGPYPLKARQGANIIVSVNVCFSCLDPDENDPLKKSVKQSLEGITGVQAVAGNLGTAGVRVYFSFFTFEPPDARPIEAAAQKALKKCAKTQFGTTDIERWVNRMPFLERRDRVRNCLGNVLSPQVMINFDSEKLVGGEDENECSEIGGCCEGGECCEGCISSK